MSAADKSVLWTRNNSTADSSMATSVSVSRVNCSRLKVNVRVDSRLAGGGHTPHITGHFLRTLCVMSGSGAKVQSPRRKENCSSASSHSFSSSFTASHRLLVLVVPRVGVTVILDVALGVVVAQVPLHAESTVDFVSSSVVLSVVFVEVG